MTPEQAAINKMAAHEMANRLNGMVPLLMFGYDPASGMWNILCHPGILPTLQSDEHRAGFIQHITELLDQSGHPENMRLLAPGDPDPVIPDLEGLERMMDTEEGGEG